MKRSDAMLLTTLGACDEAMEWARGMPDLATAWPKCKRSDWMLWALDKIGYRDDRKLRLYACACVRGTPLADGRTLWDLLTDERSRAAIEVAECYAENQATKEELAAARAAAYAYAAAAVAAAAYAWTAWAAVATTTYAASAAAAAADFAADHAAAAYAPKNAKAWQAELLRQWISWDEVGKAIAEYRTRSA